MLKKITVVFTGLMLLSGLSQAGVCDEPVWKTFEGPVFEKGWKDFGAKGLLTEDGGAFKAGGYFGLAVYLKAVEKGCVQEVPMGNQCTIGQIKRSEPMCAGRSLDKSYQALVHRDRGIPIDRPFSKADFVAYGKTKGYPFPHYKGTTTQKLQEVSAHLAKLEGKTLTKDELTRELNQVTQHLDTIKADSLETSLLVGKLTAELQQVQSLLAAQGKQVDVVRSELMNRINALAAGYDDRLQQMEVATTANATAIGSLKAANADQDNRMADLAASDAAMKADMTAFKDEIRNSVAAVVDKTSQAAGAVGALSNQINGENGLQVMVTRHEGEVVAHKEAISTLKGEVNDNAAAAAAGKTWSLVAIVISLLGLIASVAWVIQSRQKSKPVPTDSQAGAKPADSFAKQPVSPADARPLKSVATAG